MTSPAVWKGLGYQQISGPSNSALTVPAGARACYITVTGQSVRLRSDGTNPDATHGILLPVGLAPFLFQGDLNTVRFTQTSATAVMDIEYLG